VARVRQDAPHPEGHGQPLPASGAWSRIGRSQRPTAPAAARQRRPWGSGRGWHAAVGPHQGRRRDLPLSRLTAPRRA